MFLVTIIKNNRKYNYKYSMLSCIKITMTHKNTSEAKRKKYKSGKFDNHTFSNTCLI